MAEESKEAASVCVDGSSRGASERETLAKGEGADGSPKGSSRRRPPSPALSSRLGERVAAGAAEGPVRGGLEARLGVAHVGHGGVPVGIDGAVLGGRRCRPRRGPARPARVSWLGPLGEVHRLALLPPRRCRPGPSLGVAAGRAGRRGRNGVCVGIGAGPEPLLQGCLLGPLHEAALDAEAAVGQVLPAAVADLLVPDAPGPLALEPGDDGRPLRGRVDPDPSVLVVDLRRMGRFEGGRERG